MDRKSNNIKKDVLSRIKSKEVLMRPRWHFILKSALFVSGIGILLLTLIYLMSFVLFVLRESGVLFVPVFGIRGMFTFVFSSPWILVLLATIFIVVLEILVQKYSFAYKKPLLYSVIGVVLVSLLGTGIMAKTLVHERLQQSADRGSLPLIGEMYRAYDREGNQKVHVGTVEELTEQGLVIRDKHGETYEVFVNDRTRVWRDRKFTIGDEIIVLGEKSETTIEARGIRDFPDRNDRLRERGKIRGENIDRPPRNEIFREVR